MAWGEQPGQPEHPGTRPIGGPDQPPDPAYPPTAPQPQVHPQQPPAGGYPQQPPPGPYSPTLLPGHYPQQPTPGPYGTPGQPPGPPPGQYPQPPPTPYPGHYPPSGPPPGGPPTGPQGYGPPPGPPKKSKAPIIFAITAVLVLLVVGVTVAVVLTRGDSAEASEVFLQAEDQPGADPFTAPVTKDKPPTEATVPSTVKPASSSGGGQSGSSGGITSLPAAGPGLYGGTENISYCDPERMIVFLEQNPDKAAAWAGVLGIQTSEIRSYVGSLTSVLLRTDTRVTNHGFANGRATVVHSVLQAGTAVMVDKYGVPRVKCNCGNPLTTPTALRAPRYTGRQWTGYSVTNIVVVQQSTTIINNFILTDPVKGRTFERPAGTNGSDDRPVGSGTPTSTDTERSATTTEPDTTTTSVRQTTTTTRPTPTTPPPTAPTTSTTSKPTHVMTAQQVIDEFKRRRQICLNLPDINTRWPFKKANDADVYTAQADAGAGQWKFTAVNHPPGETQVWTWTFDESSRRFIATNGLASTANSGCSTIETG